jgi:hypothetical protein
LTDSAARIRQRGIEYLVVGGLHLNEKKTTLAAWLEQVRAERIATTNAIVKLGECYREWHLVRLVE